MALCLLGSACFRSGPHRRFLSRLGLVVSDSGADERLQSPLINPVAFEIIDSSSRVAFEACIEELSGIREARPMGKGKLHLALVGISDRDHSVARPHRASHPLPFLDYFPVGFEDALPDTGKGLAPPVRESRDQPVDTF